MRGVQVAHFGGPEQLSLNDVEKPSPSHGEVSVRLHRAGINFMDVYMRSGIYARSDTYKTPLPMTIGMEGAGVIETVGAGVTGWRAGQRVAYCLSRGAYADYAVVPAWRLVPVPDDIDDDIAAAAMLQGSTAHYLSHSAYALKAGDTCLIHAGAGGVGQLLIQLAKLRGARVITTVGSEAKAAIARQRGADHCILYRSDNFRERVRALTDNEGVAVAYDSVGHDTIHDSIRSIKRRGLCVLFGASSGVVASVEPLELAEAGSVYFTRPHLADYMSNATEIQSRANDLFAALRGGKLTITIDRVFPLADAAEAHRAIEARRTTGKFLLAIAD